MQEIEYSPKYREEIEVNIQRVRAYLYDGGYKSLVGVVSICVAHIFDSALVYPFSGFSAGFFATTFVVHLQKHKKIQPLNKLQQFSNAYPYLRVVCILFSLLVCNSFPILSLTSATAAGMLSGLSLVTKQSETKHAKY